MRLTLRIVAAPTAEQVGALGPAIEAGARAGLAAGAERLAEAARAMVGQEQHGEAVTWAPLAAKTVETKRERGQVGRVSATDPLLATGAMRASIRATAEGDRATVGGNGVLARHEQGTRHMPARPVLAPAAVQHGEAVAQAVADGIADAIRAALGR